MHCEQNRRLIPRYLADELSESERQELRSHLRACSRCRAEAMAEDPTLLFSTLPEPTPDAVDQARAEACARTVTAMIRQQRLAADLQRRRRPLRGWLAAAATVALALAGASLWQGGFTGGEPTPPPTPDVVQAAQDNAPPRVEVEMGGDGVRVYQMAQGDSDNTAVCFVVNEAMEL